MANPKEKLALLHDLEKENEAVQNEIDELIGEMERVPPEERTAGDWGPTGKLTQRFIELSERQNELAEEMKVVAKAVAADKPTGPVN